MVSSVAKNLVKPFNSSIEQQNEYLYAGNVMPPVDDFGNSLSLSNSMGGFQSLDATDNINVLNQNKSLSANAAAWTGPSMNPNPHLYSQQHNSLSSTSYSGLMEVPPPTNNYLMNPNYVQHVKTDDKPSLYRPSLGLSSSFDSQLGASNGGMILNGSMSNNRISYGQDPSKSDSGLTLSTNVTNSFTLSSLRDNSTEIYSYSNHVDVSADVNSNSHYQTRGQIYGAPGIPGISSNTRPPREDNNILDQIYFSQKNHSN